MTGYALHPEARTDLAEIWDYISEDSIDAADKVVRQILRSISSLVQFPHSGRRRPELTSRPLRFKVAGKFLIAYAPDEQPLWVIAIMHGRRSPRVMAAILRGRE